VTLSRIRNGFFLSLLVVAALASAAQGPALHDTSAASVASYGLSQQMPVDPEVLIGTLPNGLRYYIRANAKPAHHAELRLVVKAGSVLEDDDQQGLAHFVEHMEFEGTRHFPKQGLIDFLASLGLGLGADANAETSYDDTQYTLRIPTDQPDVLDSAMLVLEDWAQGATFDQTGIERERSIVLEEWRLHLDADERTLDKVIGAQLAGSRYANRTPIGKPDTIQHAQREQLLRFYHDWYRPDLMAVIVVGDVDRSAASAMITKHFSALSNPSPKRPRPTFDVPEHRGTRYAIVTDKEATTTAVQVSELRPARNQGSVGGYRDIMRDQLFSDMLTARLNEIAIGENPPFVSAAADRELLPAPRTRDLTTLQAVVSSDGVTRGLTALVTELQRLSRFGFTATELDRAKQATMLDYERSVTEIPDRESPSRADEYTRNFLQSEALPTIWQELAFHRRFLPGITLAEVNKLVQDWFPSDNRLIVVAAPDAAGIVLPDERQLAAAVRAASANRLTAYVDTTAGQALMEAKPVAGTIVRTTEHPETGITEWTLSNGATVVLKPTTLRENQILFQAFAPGGTSLASDADFVPASVADEVISSGGVGRFSGVTLDKMLSSKTIAVVAAITELEEGMRGGSTPQDLEVMFQLLYLRFTQPRADPTAFAAIASQTRALLANQLASPDVVFNQEVLAALSGNNPRLRPQTPATVDQWDLEKSLAFYRARFADASNFTFVFVGSFTPNTMRPLVETYLASLPATHMHETWRDLGITLPTGIVEKTVVKGIAPKSEVALVFSGPFEYDDPHKLALETMSGILESRLFDAIRRDLGSTYSITADPTYQKFPRPQYFLRIDWTCDPAQTNALVRRVFDEIASLKAMPLTESQMAVIRESLLRDLERKSQDNGYLLNEISRRYKNGESADLSAISHAADRIKMLTADDLYVAAQNYLNTDRYVKVILTPER
jgi:zinc protease